MGLTDSADHAYIRIPPQSRSSGLGLADDGQPDVLADLRRNVGG